MVSVCGWPGEVMSGFLHRKGPLTLAFTVSAGLCASGGRI